MSHEDLSILAGRVMAVLVLYKCAPEEAACWTTLIHMMQNDEAFYLEHCLVFDNSPIDFLPDAKRMPEGFELHRSPDNSGTSGAYLTAIGIANKRNCDWLLLLDQDTEIPRNYLKVAAETPQEMGLSTDVIVPRVWHGKRLVSPSLLTAFGSIRPTTDLAGEKEIRNAISSGVLIRTNVIQAIMPFPNGLWLDYVDHWMFMKLHTGNRQINIVDVDLKHDLSVRSPKRMSVSRLESILKAETYLYRHFGRVARLLLPFRRLYRAAKYLLLGNFRLAFVIMRFVFVWEQDN